MQSPGRKNAPRERDGLFDIVKAEYSERFSDEPQFGPRTPSCFETHRSTRRLWKRLRLRRAAMLLSMRATVRGGFWRKRTQAAFGQTKPSGEHARERRTNRRLCEMTAGAISLFSDCYLQ
jgi:hypothetical protein